MRKLIVILLGAALFAVALGVGRMAAPASDASAGTSTAGTTTLGTTTAETTAAATTARTVTTARREAGEDVSGPCDEAEHANDPRCTGGVAASRGGRADDDSPRRDDRGRSNRGRGGDDDGDDRSGHGRGGDDD